MLTVTFKAVIMSEEEFRISKSEEGELSVSFSQSKGSFLSTDGYERVNIERTAGVGNLTENAQTLGCRADNNRSKDHLDDVSDDERPEDVTENTEKSDSHENLHAGEPSSSSTPITRDRCVVSTCESDTTPLIKNRSSTADSCIGMDNEGDNDDTSEASCGCSYHGDKECSHCSLVAAAEPEIRETLGSLMMPGSIRVPIVGHETMEARSKFTVSMS